MQLCHISPWLLRKRNLDRYLLIVFFNSDLIAMIKAFKNSLVSQAVFVNVLMRYAIESTTILNTKRSATMIVETPMLFISFLQSLMIT